jgi:hypothetical protein
VAKADAPTPTTAIRIKSDEQEINGLEMPLHDEASLRKAAAPGSVGRLRCAQCDSWNSMQTSSH